MSGPVALPRVKSPVYHTIYPYLMGVDGFMPFPKSEVKSKQPHTGFEINSSYPFPTMITIITHTLATLKSCDTTK